jgi:D-inositol-3-phosphate glycosyltransferase
MLSIHTCPFADIGGKKTGGMNVYVRDLAIELGKRGHQVDIFTRLQENCRDHLTSVPAPNVELHHIPMGTEQSLSPIQMYPHLSEGIDYLVQFAARTKRSYDIIHSHYWLSGLIALELSQRWDIPIVQMFHTLGHMKNRVAINEAEREPALRIEAEQMIIRRVNTIVAATPAERTQLLWLYRANIHSIMVVPPGVDIHRFKPTSKIEANRAIGLDETTRMLLYVGRIERLKGIETLIRAMAFLKNTDHGILRNLSVVVIGGDTRSSEEEDQEMGRLRALCGELGLSDLIVFAGARGQDDLPNYYVSAEAVIMPSHYESFGMVALEAMATGTPVIASEVGGLAYLIQDGITGFHVPDRDPEDLAGKIRLLLENQELRNEMAAAAVKYAQTYSWIHIADQIEKVYRTTQEQYLSSKKA